MPLCLSAIYHPRQSIILYYRSFSNSIGRTCPDRRSEMHDEGLNVLTQKCNPLLVGYDTDGQTADLLDVLILWRPCDVAIGENQECCGKSFSATAKHFFNFDKNGFTRSSTVSANHKEVEGTLCMR